MTVLYEEKSFQVTVFSVKFFCVKSETTTKVANPSGMVTIPGWLNGTMADSGSQPYTLLYVSALNRIQARLLNIPTRTAAMIPCFVVFFQKSSIINAVGQAEKPGIVLHCDQTVALEHAVKIMDIANRNKYELVLATRAK